MCLHSGRMATMDEFRDTRYGWKIMKLTSDTSVYHSVCGYDYSGISIIPDMWYHPRSIPEELSDGSGQYPTGFHCCPTRKDAIAWAQYMWDGPVSPYSIVLVPIKYKGVIVFGKDKGNSTVHIATQIKFGTDYEVLNWQDGIITNSVKE